MISIRIELWNSAKLPISNRKELSTLYLHFLGRGAGFANEHTSAYFVTKGKDFFLIDCPSSTFVKVKNFDLSAYENFFVLITHTHGDHVGGLGLWAQYCFFVLHKKLNILAPSEEVAEDIKALLTIEGNSLDWYNLHLIDSDELYGNNMSVYIEPVLTKHSPQLDGKCFGYYIENIFGDEDVSPYDQLFVYTGDTSTLQPFEEFFGFVREIYVDVSVFYGQIHLKLEEVLPQLIELAQKDIKVYLMHLDDVEDAERMIADVPGIEIVKLS